jgi:hypothetical protein
MACLRCVRGRVHSVPAAIVSHRFVTLIAHNPADMTDGFGPRGPVCPSCQGTRWICELHPDEPRGTTSASSPACPAPSATIPTTRNCRRTGDRRWTEGHSSSLISSSQCGQTNATSIGETGSGRRTQLPGLVFDLVFTRLPLLDTFNSAVRSTVRQRVQRCTGIERVLTQAMKLDDALWMSSSLDPDLVRTRQELRWLAERLLVIRDTTRREELRTRTRRLVEHLRRRRPPHART